MQFLSKYPELADMIYSYLNFEDLYRCSILSKTLYTHLKELIYYRHLTYHKKFQNNYPLLKNQFKFIIEDSIMTSLFDYISSDKNLCIAGGYTTIMHFYGEFDGRFRESDIDIYVFGEYTGTNFDNLIDYMNKHYTIIDINTKGAAVVEIKISEFFRPIQIIGLKVNNIINIVDTFDLSHNKCIYYQNNTYITYDAKFSKDKKMAIAFLKMIGTRLEKIKRFDLTLLNKSDILKISRFAIEYLRLRDVSNINTIPNKIKDIKSRFQSIYDFKDEAIGTPEIYIKDLEITSNYIAKILTDKIMIYETTKVISPYYSLNQNVDFVFEINGICKMLIIDEHDNSRLTIIVTDPVEIDKLLIITDKIKSIYDHFQTRSNDDKPPKKNRYLKKKLIIKNYVDNITWDDQENIIRYKIRLFDDDQDDTNNQDIRDQLLNMTNFKLKINFHFNNDGYYTPNEMYFYNYGNYAFVRYKVVI